MQCLTTDAYVADQMGHSTKDSIPSRLPRHHTAGALDHLEQVPAGSPDLSPMTLTQRQSNRSSRPADSPSKRRRQLEYRSNGASSQDE